MFKSKEHEKVAERAKKLSYNVCIKEMCEEGDKIGFPKVNFDPKLPAPMYNYEEDMLEIDPNFEYGAKAVLQFGSEMPHYFHRHLSNGAYLVEYEIGKILEDKETKVRVRWEEGVAFTVLEKVLWKYVKNPLPFAIKNKILLPKIKPGACIHEMLKERSTLFDVGIDLAKYYGRTSVRDTLAFTVFGMSIKKIVMLDGELLEKYQKRNLKDC